MEKLPMCRICLVENVHMYVVVNRNLHELYEKLTDIPFVTEDRRPILACFFCCAKLKQCYRLLRQCLEAEELFAQMMNEGYEPNTLINQNHLEFCSGFNMSPTVHISIVDECQTESIAIKEELPAVCEGLDDIIDPKEEYQNEELEPDKLDNSCLDVADTPPHQYEADLENVVSLMEFQIKVEEEQEVSNLKRRGSETKRATVAEKPKLDTRRTKLEDTITAEQTEKDKSDSKVIRTTQQRTSKPDTCFKEPNKRGQHSFNRVKKIIQHTGTQIGEKSYNRDVCQGSLTKDKRIQPGEKPFKCDFCQSSFTEKNSLTTHIRIHNGDGPFTCDVCQRSYSAKSKFILHIRTHTGEKPFKCDICHRSFSEKGNLSRHVRIHTGEKPYKCDVCQRSFSLKGHLSRHIRTHTGEKPYKCDVCQRSFSQKGHLRTHVLQHIGEKPFKCDLCQSSFTEKSSLTTHIRIHNGDGPFTCDVCQRSYSAKSRFILHIRTHTGEKPFKCDICHRSFSIKSSFTRHVLRVHTG